MRLALVDSNPRPKVYPLPLLKIGAWKKAEGHTCKVFNNILPPAGEYDEIWVTTTFTYDVPHALGIVREALNRADTVLVGGISATLMPQHFEKLGARVHRGLLPQAESFSPDYSLLGYCPDYSIIHTSRGCVRRCGFCMVPVLEPEFVNRSAWEKDIHPDTKKVLFFDNNWLAKSIGDIRADVETLRGLVVSGRVQKIDFNQGLDARLMTEELADMMKDLPIDPVRFAFDNMQEDGHYQDAVKMMAARGFKEFMAYVLYNYKDTPKDFYYRLRESVFLAQELGVAVGSFPMRYQPIMEADTGRKFTGKRWTEQKKKGFMNILNRQSIGGAVTISNLSDFEYWFTDSADKFDTLLSYPQIAQLMACKKGALRIARY